MSKEPKKTMPDLAGSGIERRTLVKGAAWSMPVIATAVAAPLAAATGVPNLETYTITRTGNGSNKTECTFTLPVGATDITYQVAGGAGGGYLGNHGALLTGVIATPATNTQVKIVAAGGGTWGGKNSKISPTYGQAPRSGVAGSSFRRSVRVGLSPPRWGRW